MSVIGLDTKLPVPPQRKNATLNPYAVTILQEWNKCSGPLSFKRAFALKLNEVLENNKLLRFFHNDKKPSFISNNMKIVIAAQYHAENRMLARDYGVALFENENKPSQAIITQSSKFRTRLVNWLIGSDLGANVNSNTSRIAGKAPTNKKLILVSLLLAVKERLQSYFFNSIRKQTLLDGVFVPNSQFVYAKKVLSNTSELAQVHEHNLDCHYFIVLDTTQVPKKFVKRSLANIESVFGSGVTIVQIDESVETSNNTIDVSCYQGVIYHSAWDLFLPEMLMSLNQFLKSKHDVFAVQTENIDWHHAIYSQNEEHLTNIACKFTEHQKKTGLKSLSEIVKTFKLLDNNRSCLQMREPLLQVRLNKPNAL
ncbi:hypothetical protein [Psychrosphaera haliotis]|uniref:Uncharacterized protein n=1 Tax=Psychrosphaera haliotis TaxID=555083 RepID=A0A6N8F8F8_9GAMM|nr:hypothetical protein [Psychrosphaera haliotis]MUH71367.1 hypothetical protein [Psychrosphaera haliotis]